MLPSPELASLFTGSLGLSLVALDTVPAVSSVARRFTRKARQQDDGSHGGKALYRDEDGEATEESLKAFSDRWQRAAIAFFSAVGLLTSISLAVLASLPAGHAPKGYFVESWLQVGVWLLLVLQAVAFFFEPLPTKRFVLGHFAFWASVFAISILYIEDGLERYAGNRRISLDRLSRWLTTAQIAASFLRGLFCLLLPRRPDVFRNGKVVDQQYTVSALSRFSFSWAAELLRFTVKNQGLSIDDLPELPSVLRAHNLRAHFERIRGSEFGKGKLWKALVLTHWRPLVVQLSLTLFACLLSFGPQTALYEILRSLEARGEGSWNSPQTWTWVLALGALMLLSSSVEAWLFWIVYSKIYIPICEELTSVIFAKSMRRKDVKHTKRSKRANQPSPSEAVPPTSPDNNDAEKDDEEEDNLKKSRQSIINLAAIDSRRVADFASFSYIIPSSILKIVIACVFLTQLIGWKSLFAGLAMSALITPANWYASKKYAQSQDMLMKARDQKMAIVTEVLQGIRQIKFSALEEQWQEKIAESRNTELRAQWLSFLYDICLIFIWILGPLMLSAVSLAIYALLHGELTASVAFTAMSVFGSLEMSLAVLPEIISLGLETKISTDRINGYLTSPEKVATTVPSDTISFEGAFVAWPAEEEKKDEENADAEDERFVLRNLNLRIPPKGLSVVSGRTGSGKSLLLACILGESDVLGGTVKVPVPPALEDRYDHLANRENWIIDSAIAYVAQIPWIENTTIRDNILFGLPYDSGRYRKVLTACALEKDLEMFPDGELTDIGANGVNLSGGQKWRVSFARALYSRAGILIMDDIFSALDAHTGRHVYEHALAGELGQNRTRVLVTHHVALCLASTDYSILLADGSVKHSGTIEDLRRTDSLADILSEEQAAERADHAIDEEEEEPLLNGAETAPQKNVSNTEPQRIRSSATAHNTNGNENGAATAKDSKNPKKFVQEEGRETGSIKLSLYTTYLRKGGSVPYWLLGVVAYLTYVCLLIGRSWWVNVWTSASHVQSHPEKQLSLMTQTVNRVAPVKPRENNDLLVYLGVYVGLSFIACVVGAGRYYIILSAAIRASRNLFSNLTYAVLRAPLRWLDTVPLGRILNRFTADFHAIDSRLGYDLGFFANKVLEMFGIMVAGVLVSPLVIVCGLILLAFCLRLSLSYLAGAREIKRLESNAKSPVFEQFGSSLNGLITIRGFSKVKTYVEIMYSRINRHAQAMWNLWLFNRWLGFRMNLVGAVFSTITAALVVYVPGITASLAGFALSFALQYNSAISMALRQYANIELNMNATERVVEYSNVKIENQDGANVPAAWPTEGRLEIRDLVVGYASDLPPVLSGLTFTAEKNQRVGVVGRTGAGKSSLTLALFRFLEARKGSIHIDGIDVSKIKLHDLRSRLAIIPQDPVLFSGSVRSNLDPFSEYTDSELFDALERVHLVSSQEGRHRDQSSPSPASISTTRANTNTNAFTSLSSTVSEGGLNLSQGQRQLLCLARAIISRPKVMVLDEATSAVDMETDALIQQSIRAEFGRNATTLLVIAHRLSTIADFDKILVMDVGKAAEFGSPRELMGIEGGIFRGLVENSGEKDVLQGIIFGDGK